MRRVLAPAREELLLLSGLTAAIAAIGFTRSSGHLESALWMLMLGLQALPYLAAIVCACAAALPERRAQIAGSATRLPADDRLRAQEEAPALHPVLCAPGRPASTTKLAAVARPVCRWRTVSITRKCAVARLPLTSSTV